MIAPRVEAVVISTDKATSPCAMYVATFEDCKREITVFSLQTAKMRHMLSATAEQPAMAQKLHSKTGLFDRNRGMTTHMGALLCI